MPDFGHVLVCAKVTEVGADDGELGAGSEETGDGRREKLASNTRPVRLEDAT